MRYDQALRIIAVIIVLFFANTLKAQSKKEDKLIIGKWATVEDPESKLIFSGKFVYHLYEKDTTAKYEYVILDSSNSTAVRIPIIRFVEFSGDGNDTNYFALQGLSDKWLSLFDMTHSQQTWLLKRKK